MSERGDKPGMARGNLFASDNVWLEAAVYGLHIGLPSAPLTSRCDVVADSRPSPLVRMRHNE